MIGDKQTIDRPQDLRILHLVYLRFVFRDQQVLQCCVDWWSPLHFSTVVGTIRLSGVSYDSVHPFLQRTAVTDLELSWTATALTSHETRQAAAWKERLTKIESSDPPLDLKYTLYAGEMKYFHFCVGSWVYLTDTYVSISHSESESFSAWRRSQLREGLDDFSSNFW